jgi:hypothetical protein
VRNHAARLAFGRAPARCEIRRGGLGGWKQRVISWGHWSSRRRVPGGAATKFGSRHLAQAIGQAAIQQNYRVMYRETHVLLDDLAEAVAESTR